MSVATIDVMRQAITQPFARGMETQELHLDFVAVAVDGTIPIGAYDFGEYQHAYERLPEAPRYLLIPQFSPTEDLDISIDYGAASPAVVRVPAGQFAGVSIAIPIAATALTRLASLRAQPASAPTMAAGAWRIVAVLGNLAKVLWVVGAEYEELRGTLDRVTAQRDRHQAMIASLDLLGNDLGIPRFPAVAYSFEGDTLALYHLDDVLQPAQTQVADAPRPDGSLGHPATNHGAFSGRPGRFNTAFEFTAATGGTFITAPDHADFALPAAASFTVEAMLRPATRMDGKGGGVVAKRASLNLPARVGWALAVGPYRGIDSNVRFSLSDGAGGSIELFADRDLGDGIFHHVAGVIERRSTLTIARLYLDGQVVSTGSGAVGPLTNTEPLVIGYGVERVTTTAGTVDQDAQFLGTIDEVRLSKVARTSFHPVTGEGNEEYRKRLGMFQRWILPTPQAIQDTVNGLVTLDGTAGVAGQSFLIEEATRGIAQATRFLRVLPAELRHGQSIAADGNMRVTVDQAAGTADDDPDFDAAWLLRHDDPRAAYSNEGARWMQVGVADALNRLLDRAGQGLTIISGYESGTLYEPRQLNLHRVGRALRLTHSLVGPGDLAARAHAAGFDYVERTVVDEVFVAQGKREAFTIQVAGRPVLPGGGPPPFLQADVALYLNPDPGLADVQINWRLIRCGEGDGGFVDQTTGNLVAESSGHQPVFRGTKAGNLLVRADVTRERHRATATSDVRIALADTALGMGESTSGAGQRGASEDSASGLLSSYFQPTYLVVRDDDSGLVPVISYGSDPLRRRMDRAASAALNQLIPLVPPALTVVRAYDPAATDLHAQGRALDLTHSSLPLPTLAARAFQAGFDFIRIEAGPPQVLHVSVWGGELIGVDIRDDVGSATDEVRVRDRLHPASAPLHVDILPKAKPPAACFSPDGALLYVANEGTDDVTPLQLTAPSAASLPGAELHAPIPAGHRPVALAATTGSLYVVNAGSDSVSVIDRNTLQVTATLLPGKTPHAIARRPDQSKVYVACIGDAIVATYATATNAKVNSATIGLAPFAIALSPDGLHLYVADAGTGTVRVLLEASLQVTVTLAMPVTGAMALLAKPDGSRLYVSCANDDSIQVFQTSNYAQVGAIRLAAGVRPQALAISTDEHHLFVACANLTQLLIVPSDENSTEATKSIPLDRGVAVLVPSPLGASYLNVLVAVAPDDGRITVIDPSAVGTSRSTIVQSVLLGSGLGERVSWTVSALRKVDGVALGDATLSSDVSSHVDLTGTAPGGVMLKAFYVQPRAGDLVDPYQFRVRVNPALLSQLGATGLIRKDQYDLIMNIVANFHPIGVEVITDELRQHVMEFRVASTETFPTYTYPAYRMRRPFLPPRKEG